MSLESGEQPAAAVPTAAARGLDLALKVSVPILLGVAGWTFTQLMDHGNRLTALEIRGESVVDDVREIKADVKKLLRGK